MNARVIFTKGAINIRMSELMTHEEVTPLSSMNTRILISVLSPTVSVPPSHKIILPRQAGGRVWSTPQAIPV